MVFIFFDASCSDKLCGIFARGEGSYFSRVDNAADADVILFGSDEYHYIVRNELYRQYTDKCICISETDLPTYVLPSIYSSNRRTLFIGLRRSETTNYLLGQLTAWNEWVHKSEELKREKKYLYSFLGGSTSFARKRLFRHYFRGGERFESEDVIIEATDTYEHWNCESEYALRKESGKRRYAEIMAESKYVLCPRGAGASSFRLFEAMEMGIAPVILSDRWVPIAGVDWSFAIFVSERKISSLDSIVRHHASEWIERGKAARIIFDQQFSNEHTPRKLYEQIGRLRSNFNPGKEKMIRLVLPAISLCNRIYARFRRKAKILILKTMISTEIASPYRLNRPIEDQLKGRRRDWPS